MRTLLTDLALMAVVVALSGMATGSFAAVCRGVQAPEPCPRGCGAPAGAGHQCGGTQ